LVEKAANSNILLEKQNCFREQVSRVQIFTASKNFYFDQENKFRIGLRRLATPPNMEYIFSQAGVIIKP